jgi:iron transport multicopper oxidase
MQSTASTTDHHFQKTKKEKMRLLATCLLVVGSTGLSQAARVVYDWNVTYTTANPDGLFERQVVGVNGAWP